MNTASVGISKRQKAFLHAVTRGQGMAEEMYRELLKESAGVDNSTELDQWGFDLVVDRLKCLGFVEADGPTKRRYSDRKGKATGRQLRYIDDLRFSVFGANSERAFTRWLEHYYHVSHTQFLDPRQASGVIEALKSMKGRIASGQER